ncbi:MAG: hypothetical protein LBU46_01500, partial [Candidatus Accumulibacter sp.]|nr:hypothetical protein [Accumulibacter sp.]
MDSEIDPRTRQEIERHYPGAKVREAASGALSDTRDGHVAALLANNDNQMWMAVFEKTKGGKLKKLVSSPAWAWSPGDRGFESIGIVKKNVVLSFWGNRGCSGSSM